MLLTNCANILAISLRKVKKIRRYLLSICAAVYKRRALLPKRGALQVVKTKTCLWYFCGQTRNYRSSHCGNFQFWWTVRGSNPRPRRCERRALPAELTAQINHFSIKKVAKNGFLRYSILRRKSGKSDC